MQQLLYSDAATAADETVEPTTAVGITDTIQTDLNTAVQTEIDSDANVADLLASANTAADTANTAIADAATAVDTLEANSNPTSADIATAQNTIDAANTAISTAADAATSYSDAATAADETVEPTTAVGITDTIQTDLNTAVQTEIDSDANVAVEVDNVVTLTVAANDAATVANEAAAAADIASSEADTNPTPTNLALAQTAQVAADTAATAATNAATTLNSAIDTLEATANAAAETVDTTAAEAAVTNANTSSTTAIASGTIVNDRVSNVSDSDTAENAIDENVADGTYTGVTLNATDADGDAITYSVADDVPFSVDADGKVITDGAIDFEENENFTFDVTATSADGTSSTTSVTIDVNDIVENVGPVAVDDLGNNSVTLTDTITSNITIDDSPSLNLNGKENFELSVSVTPDGEQGNYDIIFNKESSVELAFTNDGHLQFAMKTDDEAWAWHTTDVEYDADSINNITFTYDGENVTITNTGADGQTQSFEQSYTGGIVDSGNDLMIGNRPYGGGIYSMDGDVDDISVSIDGEKVLSLDFQGNNPLADSSGKGNDAIVGNGASLNESEGLVTDEDTAITIDVLANDTDADGDTLGITQIQGQDVSDGQTVNVTDGDTVLGTASVVDGKVEFTPSETLQEMNDGENQDVSFEYTVSDGNGGTDTGSVSVNVTGSDDINYIDGSDDRSSITGTSGDDIIDLSEGADHTAYQIVQGGDGTDTVIFDGDRADYTVDHEDGNGRFVMTNIESGEKNYIYDDVESIQFADTTLATFTDGEPTAALVNDTVSGTDSNLSTGSGDDIIDLSEGADHTAYQIVQGGDGTDTVIFDGDRADYTVDHEDGNGRFVMTNIESGEKNYIYDDVESIQFADTTLATFTDGEPTAALVNDTVSGTDSNLSTGSGDDTIDLSEGADHTAYQIVQGGDGTDTVIFDGDRADYTVDHEDGNGRFVMTNIESGEKNYIYDDVESIQFADTTLATFTDGEPTAALVNDTVSGTDSNLSTGSGDDTIDLSEGADHTAY
ncbi:MAG: Ig-like domain-containing protein [Sulfurimonas sp.]|nr:Ig-like domain-containing protein [Sulfurimonas sp.]